MTDQKPPCLTVLGGPMAGHRFALLDGVVNILIGSDPVCGFHLPLPGVSAMHARLTLDAGGLSLGEAGSPRGLHVNDSRVEGSAVIRNGDIIWLGRPGDEDVVMLQCILPRLPALVAAEPPALPAPAVAMEDADTLRLDPRSISLEPDPEPEPEPTTESQTKAEPQADGASSAEEPAPVADRDEPLANPPMVDTPLMAHFEAVAAVHEPEEAGLVVDADAMAPLQTPTAPPMATFGATAAQEFVLADDEGMPLTIQEPASSFAPPVPPTPAPMETVMMPPGFEDETEERLFVPPTVIGVPEPHEVDPNAYRAAYDLTLPATQVAPPVAPARTPAAPAAPSAPPAPPRSTTGSTPRSTPTPVPSRAARPASPPASKKPEPAEKPSAPAAPPDKPSSTGLYAGLAIAALVLLGGAAYGVMKMMGGKAPAVAQATPAPTVPSTAPTEAPITATPAPETPSTPEMPTPAPTAVTSTPTPAPTPTARPTPTPSPAKPGATPTPTPAPTPAGPSAEQVRAQQLAGFLAQADTAMGARQFDQAISHFDEALKLDPGNAKATADRAIAIAARDAARRRFVAGRTVVTTDKAAAGGLSGFEGAAVQKAPDFQGRIEFEMSPASGLKPGDAWTLKLFVVNEGKKLIRITDLNATAVVNGERTGGAAGARAREIAPQARVQVGEMTGAWKDGTQSWTAEVLLTAKGDSLKNTLTWK